MKALTIGAGLGVLMALGGCAPGGPGMSRQLLSVSMTGLQQVPGPGDSDGNGTVQIRLTPRDGRLCWDLYARAIEPATAAHIHRGAAGTAGPPVVALTTPDANGRSQGCATLDPMLARQIAMQSHDFYVNVHNPAFPTGAIRGQLRGGGGGPSPRQPRVG